MFSTFHVVLSSYFGADSSTNKPFAFFCLPRASALQFLLPCCRVLVFQCRSPTFLLQSKFLLAQELSRPLISKGSSVTFIARVFLFSAIVLVFSDMTQADSEATPFGEKDASSSPPFAYNPAEIDWRYEEEHLGKVKTRAPVDFSRVRQTSSFYVPTKEDLPLVLAPYCRSRFYGIVGNSEASLRVMSTDESKAARLLSVEEKDLSSLQASIVKAAPLSYLYRPDDSATPLAGNSSTTPLKARAPPQEATRTLWQANKRPFVVEAARKEVGLNLFKGGTTAFLSVMKKVVSRVGSVRLSSTLDMIGMIGVQARSERSCTKLLRITVEHYELSTQVAQLKAISESVDREIDRLKDELQELQRLFNSRKEKYQEQQVSKLEAEVQKVRDARAKSLTLNNALYLAKCAFYNATRELQSGNPLLRIGQIDYLKEPFGQMVEEEDMARDVTEEEIMPNTRGETFVSVAGGVPANVEGSGIIVSSLPEEVVKERGVEDGGVVAAMLVVMPPSAPS
ncbi:uncharacterized protein G2W53_041100 [Senna tora]|uniref:Uncharacterized protein n=1 Tax=Senna tora TaxID=362788 RepID=A0A834SRE2_9FABA|nr:uncharacterized protein G2W53_041100 [Senna tora]